MPYISGPRREAYAHLKAEIKKTRIDFPGELTYLFDVLADLYMSQHLFEYRTLNEVMGCFESAKLEFYRRLSAGYEDSKLAANGDVFESIRREVK